MLYYCIFSIPHPDCDTTLPNSLPYRMTSMALVIRNERKIGENASVGNRVTFLVHKSFLSVAIPYRNLCANAQRGGKRSFSRPFAVRFQPPSQIMSRMMPPCDRIMAVVTASDSSLCRFCRESILSNRREGSIEDMVVLNKRTRHHFRHNPAAGRIAGGVAGIMDDSSRGNSDARKHMQQS